MFCYHLKRLFHEELMFLGVFNHGARLGVQMVHFSGFS